MRDKISRTPNNDYCPQTLFAYGTYKENGEPNFGLFCWFSYCWMNELGAMACIGGSKLTLDRIRETRVFSANLVTEELLPLADYFGTADGYSSDKMAVTFEWQKGEMLEVPVLSASPVSYELEVVQIVPLEEKDCVVLLCRIQNVLMDPLLANQALSFEEKLQKIAPISTTCMTYFSWNGKQLGAWHKPAEQIKGNVKE